MGFGGLIGMDIHDLPGFLGYHVLSMVDDEKRKLGTSNGAIEITEYKVHEIMGIPNGEVPIDCLEERKPNDHFIQEWFQQFPSILMKYREKIEIESGGFGLLPKEDDVYINSLQSKNFVEKIQRSFNNINIEVASISSSLKAGLSQFPSCDNLKKLLEEFKKGISSNAFMEEDRGCDQSQAEANINAESQYRTQAESTNEVEKPIEDKSHHSEKEHDPPVDIEEQTKENEKNENEKNENEKNAEHEDKEDENENNENNTDCQRKERIFEDDDDLGFENQDDVDLGSEKKNENENKNSYDDADGFKKISKEEINENEKKNESQSTEEVFESVHGTKSKDEEIKAKEDKELHHMQKRKRSEDELERRQKQRVEEVRESEKKKEESINLKEQYRIQVRDRLAMIERRSLGFRSFLFCLDMYIPEDDYEFKKAKKNALVKFHPDRVQKDDLYKLVEAEETFKVIQGWKDPTIVID